MQLWGECLHLDLSQLSPWSPALTSGLPDHPSQEQGKPLADWLLCLDLMWLHHQPLGPGPCTLPAACLPGHPDAGWHHLQAIKHF